MKLQIIFLLGALLKMNAVAQELSKEDLEALEQTQNLLRSKTQREENMKNSPESQTVDSHVDKLVGGNAALKENVYMSASSIFEVLTKKSNGDVNKLKELMDKAKGDPEAFYNSLPEAEKAKIRDIAGQINPGSGTKP